jgi:hypothetical protein
MREYQVRFCERLGVKFPGRTRQLLSSRTVSRISALGLGRVKTFRPRETGDAKLNLACCRNCELESMWFARSAVCDLVAPMRTPMRTPHVWIAAMRGFTPMTRVRL